MWSFLRLARRARYVISRRVDRAGAVSGHACEGSLPLHIAAFRHRSPEWLGLVCVSDLRRLERDLGRLVRDLRHLGRDLGQLCS